MEVSQRPQNVLSSSSLLPTLAWPTGPQKALPVSLATPVQHSIPLGQRGQEHHRHTEDVRPTQDGQVPREG